MGLDAKSDQQLGGLLMWVPGCFVYLSGILATVIVYELVFRRSVYADPAALDRAPKVPGSAKVAAALSLVLWSSIACCGRGIGYIEPPLNKIHAQLHFLNEAALTALDPPSGPEGRNR